MASGILSSVLRLADKLSSSVRRSLAGAASSSSSDAPHVVEDDLKKLKCTLEAIESVLRDAERREVREESVKLWLRELKGVAYDADDVLDEFEYELLRSRRSFSHPPSKPGRKRKHGEVQELATLPSPLDDASFRRRMVLQIKEINRRLDAIARDRTRLRLTEADGPRRAEKAAWVSTSSHAQPSEIYGREDERKKLVDLLLSADYGGSNVSVVSIVGMAGVGKSTLAQLVCSDQRVSQHFDVKGWVGVHENFDAKRLLHEIIDSVTKSLCDHNEIGALEEHLKERLQGKRFLLVLDDVWNEEQVLWERLRLALSSGAAGSRVLVTTRIEPVARIMQSAAAIELNCLSDNDCRSLFERWAFDGRDPKANPRLVEIGRNISLKCRGLPLAARVMGGLLRYETDEESWIDLLQSDVWDLDETGNAILPALKLSYQHLPVHLKRCFVHCVVFPKGFVFKKDPLVRQWMVQGFIQAAEDDDDKAPEDVASEYFDELVSRSFFQYSLLEFGEEEKFLMHDLLHDLARYISGEECVVTENSDLCDLSAETRHLSLTPYGSNVKMEFKSAAKEVPLRSLQLIYTVPYFYGGAAMLDFNLAQIKLPTDFFSKFLCLRTLDLAYTAIEELPESVSNLKHLRYLSLRNTKIRKLPESVCKLWYLQTLDLENCSDLCELPSGIGELADLRHLLLPSIDQSFVCIPSGIMSLTNLQELSAINVGGDGAHCGIGELKNMKDLRGDLYISGLRNVARGGDAKQANLESKSNIQRLTLDWYAHQSDRKCSHSKLSSDRGYYDTKAITAPCEFFEDESVVLENLRPNADVVVLHIRNYGGKQFSNWLGDPSFSSLQTLQLYMCEKCEYLPQLGDLPCLKNLYVRGMPSVRRIGPEICSGVKKFAALEKLEFEWMPEWEEWIGVGESAFPRLDELALLGCPKLKHFPVTIAPSLEKLRLRDCHQVAAFPAPHSLTSLSIAGACQETIWSCILNLPLLEEMEVVCCEGLTALPLFNMPALKTLAIEGCSQLVSIDCGGCAPNVCDVASSSTSSAGTLVGLHNLVSLEVLKIEDCPMVRFAEDERLPPKLKELDISCCPALMEWCLGPKGSAQLAAVPEVIVDDYDQDLLNEIVMDTMNEESDTMNEESEDGMEDD
ncbi:putative disease resistance RPP13-like protein 1 [Ananas comosus]|uniref:Putative disease resistance RPP13-like protein 1 n=1 Tax=Ananas comosus TaxID=4615 RepID=A0A199VPX5_ANACO|nr:putative disease resistance RPP13-like protein 1 [Ananas comosus]